MSRANSVLFKPIQIGHITLKNRFVRSATHEGLATENGNPSKALLDLMMAFAESDVGLIIPGVFGISRQHVYLPNQSMMNHTINAAKWASTTEKIKKAGSGIIFQLNNSMAQPNPDKPDEIIPLPSPIEGLPTRAFTIADIEDKIQLWRNAATHSYKAGAQGIQLHCAHSSPLSKFLSPYYNKRTDQYGGSPENRIRIVKEIIHEIRASIPKDFIISIKLNGNDYLPGGITPKDASYYVHLLKNDVDLFEISAGNGNKTNSSRSIYYEKPLVHKVPKEERAALLENVKKTMTPFEEAYNLEACKVIREKNPDVKLALVGGMRSFDVMQKAVESGVADLVSMSRPFIRDPYLVRRLRYGTIDAPTCINCNACLVNLTRGVYCRVKADP